MVKQQVTKDPGEIQAWASQHGFRPVEILPSRVDHEPAMLAFARPAEIRDQLREIAWDQFLKTLDVLDLILVYDAGSEREGATDFYEIVNNRPSSTLAPQTLQA